jgi:hypothetical protein
VCDLETSRIGAPYIYNVRLLRVKRTSFNSDLVDFGGTDHQETVF